MINKLITSPLFATRRSGVDVVANSFFAGGVDKNQDMLMVVFALCAAILIPVNQPDLLVSLWFGIIIAFACRDRMIADDKVMTDLVAECKAVDAAPIQAVDAAAKESVASMLILAAIAVHPPRFSRRPSNFPKIPSFTLYPRLVATPWVVRA